MERSNLQELLALTSLLRLQLSQHIQSAHQFVPIHLHTHLVVTVMQGLVVAVMQSLVVAVMQSLVVTVIQNLVVTVMQSCSYSLHTLVKHYVIWSECLA